MLREKSAGANPGFTARDANGETWFLQFDSPEYPGRQHRRGRDRDQAVLGARLQPGRDVHHDASIRRASRSIPKATVKRPSGARTPFTRDDIERVLERAARNADGTYRVVGRPPAAGQDPRAVPLRGHALRRSQRPRAARAPPRAARAARLRRVDEPGRLEGRQHARHARSSENGRIDREALPAGRRLDVRHGEQPARVGHGLGVLLRSRRRAAAGSSRSASRSARGRPCPTRVSVDRPLRRRPLRSDDVEAADAGHRRTSSCAPTMRSGRRGG